MSLNYDLSKIKDFAEIQTDEAWPTTQGMIFTTMGVGIGQLTEKNWKVFYARQHVLATLHGAYDAFTPEQVKRYIGLHTNATFQDETPAHWNKRIMESRLTELAFSAKRWEDSLTPQPLEDWEQELMGLKNEEQN